MNELPMASRPDRCETCRFWEPYDGDTDPNEKPNQGDCHRFPPKLAAKENRESTDELTGCYNHPATLSHDWCGEWRPSDTHQLLVKSTSTHSGLPPWDKFFKRLPGRTRNIFAHPRRPSKPSESIEPIDSWERLLDYDEGDLLGLRNFGMTTLISLRILLAEYGIKLRT